MINNRTQSQAHWLVALANTPPKPAKELALPTHEDRQYKARNSNTQYKKLGRKW